MCVGNSIEVIYEDFAKQSSSAKIPCLSMKANYFNALLPWSLDKVLRNSFQFSHSSQAYYVLLLHLQRFFTGGLTRKIGGHWEEERSKKSMVEHYLETPHFFFSHTKELFFANLYFFKVATFARNRFRCPKQEDFR